MIFLTRKAEEMGCTVVDDEISHVSITEWNNVECYLQSKNEKYEYDFYVDCTGFAKLLNRTARC